MMKTENIMDAKKQITGASLVLEQFRIAYGSNAVTVQDGALVYRVASGTAVRAAAEARKFAAVLGLPVEISPAMLLSLNSFSVTLKNQA